MSNRKSIIGIAIAFACVLWIAYGPKLDAQIISPSTGPTQSGSVSAGDCVAWGPGIGQIQSAGAACSGSSLLTLNQNSIFVGNASNVATGVAVSGDCSIVANGAITCTKTNGSNFAASATTDTTVATNISSGVFDPARLPIYFLSLSGDQTVTDTNAAQTWFPGGGATQYNVPAGGAYFISGVLMLDGSNGTSHNVSTVFGGTATIASINGTCLATSPAASVTITTPLIVRFDAATATVCATTSAGSTTALTIQGMVRFSGAGTFIPQFKFSTAPAVTVTVKANSNFNMRYGGTQNVLSNGNWN